jgi:hypothetical protein
MANFQILNNIDHRNLRIITERSADYGDNVWYTVTFPSEFRAVQRHYPVFFIKHSETGEYQAAAMFGVEEGENLFLDENGWNASYIPLNLMRQPFLVGFQESTETGRESQEPVVTVDMDHPRVSLEKGEPVFLEHGGNTEFLEQINSILNAVFVGTRSSKPFFATLQDLNLIESFVLDAQLYDGSEHRLAGFYTINEEVLGNLDGAHLEMLNKKGYLEAIYMVIASMTNLPTLLERKNELRKAAVAHAEN